MAGLTKSAAEVAFRRLSFAFRSMPSPWVTHSALRSRHLFCSSSSRLSINRSPMRRCAPITTASTEMENLVGRDLRAAAKDGDDAALEKLLVIGGSSVNSTCKEHSRTALHYAAQHGNHKALKLLLEVGADPNATDKNGQTALHLCMPSGYTGCVVHLYNAGIDESIKDNKGMTAADITMRESGGGY